MKFTCTHCGKRYASSDVPVSGRVYRIRCHQCGGIIFVNAAAMMEDTPAPPSARPSGRARAAPGSAASGTSTSTPPRAAPPQRAAAPAVPARAPRPPPVDLSALVLEPIDSQSSTAPTDLSALVLEPIEPSDALDLVPNDDAPARSETWPTEGARRGAEPASPWMETSTGHEAARAPLAAPPLDPEPHPVQDDPFAAARAAAERQGLDDPFLAAGLAVALPEPALPVEAIAAHAPPAPPPYRGTPPLPLHAPDMESSREGERGETSLSRALAADRSRRASRRWPRLVGAALALVVAGGSAFVVLGRPDAGRMLAAIMATLQRREADGLSPRPKVAPAPIEALAAEPAPTDAASAVTAPAPAAPAAGYGAAAPAVAQPAPEPPGRIESNRDEPARDESRATAPERAAPGRERPERRAAAAVPSRQAEPSRRSVPARRAPAEPAPRVAVAEEPARSPVPEPVRAPPAPKVAEAVPAPPARSDPAPAPAERPPRKADAAVVPPAPAERPSRKAEAAAAAPADGPGPVDQADIQAGLARSRPSLEVCVKEALAGPGGEALSGRRTGLLLLIGPNGRAEGALEDPDLDDTPLGLCLKRAATRMRFASFRGEAVGARVPIQIGR